MKIRGVVLVSLTLVLLASLSVLYYPASHLTGHAVYVLPLINNCSNQSALAIWDSVFKESSADIKVYFSESDAGCNKFYAYKNKSAEFRLLIWSLLNSVDSTEGLLKSYQISAIKANLTSEYSLTFINKIENLSFVSVTRNSTNFLSIAPIYSAITANSSFAEVFKIVLPAVSIEPHSANDSIYIYSEIDDAANYALSGSISANYSLMNLVYSWSSIMNCTPVWVPINTTCNSTSSLTLWYDDINLCKLRFPSQNYSAPQNQTFSCGSSAENSALIIGNLDSISQSNLINLSLYIDGSAVNFSKNYSGELRLEIKENSSLLVNLTYNFSQGLNLSAIKLKKQGATSDFGYLLISGLDVEKTVYINRLNYSSDKVCVKDSSVSSISEITDNCNASNEYLISCPGTSNSRKCGVLESAFAVSGISHSGVKELSNLKLSCTSNWNCTLWGPCMSGSQIRTCSDLNFCNNLSAKPLELQSCISAVSCVPDWTCTNWTKCAKNKTQIRECQDANNCSTSTDKPSEHQTCIGDSSSGDFVSKLLVGFLIGAIVLAILAIIIYLIFSNKRNRSTAPPSSKLKPLAALDVSASEFAQS